MTLLGLYPAQFWEFTPAETADLVFAFRKRENRRLMQRAWEISLLLSPHVAKEDRDAIAPVALFLKMPGAFAEDEPQLKVAGDPGLTPEQQAERARRMAIKRIQRPR